ncbi:MAG: hypothetical protein V4449_00640 [Patescibacteria group bacterium]
MNRRLILIVVLFLFGIVLVSGYFFFTAQKTPNGGTPAPRDFFSAFFPFGAGTPATKTPEGSTEEVSVQKVLTRLRQVSSRPTAGSWFASEASTTTPSHIRFMERATGHIFETPVDSYTEVRLSNTTIPLIQDLIAITDSTLLLRTLPDTETIVNAFAVLNATSSQQSVYTLPLKGFKRSAVAKSGLTMLTVSETSGGSHIELMQPDGAKPRTVLLSPIRSWVPLAGGERFFIASAPSSGISGFLYEIKTNGTLTKIIGDVPGLLALPSPGGRYVLYSSGVGIRTTLGMVDTKTGQTYASPLGTLATKCAWISEEAPLVFCGVSDPLMAGSIALPDDWLLGKIARNDSAWIIRPLESTAQSLGHLEEIAGTPVDLINPVISPDQKYVTFMNKNDLTLWSLDLTRDE